MQLYGKQNVDLLRWPNSDQPAPSQKFLPHLIKNGLDYYINNVKGEIIAGETNGIIFPVTICSENYNDSYVCSPYSQYMLYGLENIQKMMKHPLRRCIETPIKGLGHLLKKNKINHVAYINNLLFSTTLYPNWDPSILEKIYLGLIREYPEHAIIFRSLNTLCYQKMMKQLEIAGFDLVFSRPIYILDPTTDNPFRCRMFKSDYKLLKEKGYQIVTHEELKKEDAPRILELYTDLYIEKHSQLNPHLNLTYIELAIETKMLTFIGLKKNNSLDAIVGYYIQDGVMANPFFGYDRKIPQEIGLYRQISTVLTLEAKEKGLLLNQSSGAADFKLKRRAEKYWEYSAIYTKHLNFYRKLPWKVLKFFLNNFGLSLCNHMKL